MSAEKRQKANGLISLRVRSPSGKTVLLEAVDPCGGVIRFLERVKEAAGIEEADDCGFTLRAGVPPKKLDIALSEPVSALNLEDKSTIIVELDTRGVSLQPFDSGWRAAALAERRVKAAAAAGDEAAISKLAASAKAKEEAATAANAGPWRKQFIAVLGERPECPLRFITSDKAAGYYSWRDVSSMLEGYDKDSDRVTKLASPGIVTVKLANTSGELRKAAGAGSCILGTTKPSGYCVVMRTSDLKDFASPEPPDFVDEDFDMELFKEILSQGDYNECYDPDKDSPPVPAQPQEYTT
jgi:hypothetical protein